MLKQDRYCLQSIHLAEINEFSSISLEYNEICFILLKLLITDEECGISYWNIILERIEFFKMLKQERYCLQPRHLIQINEFSALYCDHNQICFIMLKLLMTDQECGIFHWNTY